MRYVSGLKSVATTLKIMAKGCFNKQRESLTEFFSCARSCIISFGPFSDRCTSSGRLIGALSPKKAAGLLSQGHFCRHNYWVYVTRRGLSKMVDCSLSTQQPSQCGWFRLHPVSAWRDHCQTGT